MQLEFQEGSVKRVLLLLCLWVRAFEDGRELVDLPRVRQLHDYYLDLLAYEIEQNHALTHGRVLIKIFQLLPLLGPINAEQAVAILNLKVDAPPGYLPVISASTSRKSRFYVLQ